MKSMRRLYILMALTLTPVVAFGDLVMGTIGGVRDNAYVAGWVCDRGSTDSLRYQVFVDGPQGTGQFIGGGQASLPTEPAVDSNCGHAGQDGSHRFIYTFSEEEKQAHQGKPIYIHGIRNGLESRLLNGSGSFTVPAPGAVDPGPIDPETTGDNTADDLNDGAPGGLNSHLNVTIDEIVLWENAEVNPLYFKLSDNVLCYIPAGEPTLQSLILTLYSSGNPADIHCHAEEENVVQGINPAHKLHRIIAK